jgi:DNA polymerase elongation subunit (family B)
MNNYPIVNVYNKGKIIYLFCRQPDGSLKIIKDHSFTPYFYEPNEQGKFIGYDKIKLDKIKANEPKEIAEMRSENSYESDILYPKRYIIDKINEFEKCPVKWAMIDIEVLHPEEEYPDPMTAKFPISSITVYNSKFNKIRTWFLMDYFNKTESSMAETYLFIDFIDYLRKAKFDVIFGWYMRDFDYPMLYNRFSQFPQRHWFEKESKYNNFAVAISPIGMVRGSGSRDHRDIFYPAGTSIVDYLTYFKKIYKGEKSYALDTVMEKYLGRGKEFKEIDFSKLTQEVKLRNIGDVQGMVDLENKFKLIPIFDSIRRFAKVNWEDFEYPLRLIDSLFLQTSKEKNVILPKSGGYEEKEVDIEGAYRESFETGFFEMASKYDIGSCYPSLIVDLCLDPSNLRISLDNNVLPINILNRETMQIMKICFIEQNPETILPLTIKKLLIEKEKFKTLKKNTNPELPEYENIELTYEGIKVIVNCGWGGIANKYCRLFNEDIAGLITSSARDLLHFLKDETNKLGYKVIYTDTDGLIVSDNGKDLTDILNDLIQQWSKLRFNKVSSIKIEREGIFEKLFINTLCRYKGLLRTKKGLKPEVKGLQMKRKDSTIFIAKFQEEIINKIFNKENYENIVEWIKSEIEKLKTLPMEDISFPARLSQKPELYKTEVTNTKGKTYTKDPPIFVRALKNTELLTGKTKRIGELFYWCYVKSEEPKKNVLAFDNKFKEHIKEIDYDKMVERNIFNIVEPIFIAMQWDNPFIPMKVKRTGKKKEITNLTLDLT